MAFVYVLFPPFRSRCSTVESASGSFRPCLRSPTATQRVEKKKTERKGKCSSKRARQRRATFLSRIVIRDAYTYIFLSFFPTNGSLINYRLRSNRRDFDVYDLRSRRSPSHGSRRTTINRSAHWPLSCNFQFMSILYSVLGRSVSRTFMQYESNRTHKRIDS